YVAELLEMNGEARAATLEVVGAQIDSVPEAAHPDELERALSSPHGGRVATREVGGQRGDVGARPRHAGGEARAEVTHVGDGAQLSVGQDVVTSTYGLDVSRRPQPRERDAHRVGRDA